MVEGSSGVHLHPIYLFEIEIMCELCAQMNKCFHFPIEFRKCIHSAVVQTIKTGRIKIALLSNEEKLRSMKT